MPPDTLRERLTTAFLDYFKVLDGARTMPTSIDTFGAYDLADVALKVFKKTATRSDLGHDLIAEECLIPRLREISCSCGWACDSTFDADEVDSVFADHLRDPSA
jgi:hypothetical protein